jgi:hypothetical protein
VLRCGVAERLNNGDVKLGAVGVAE